MASLEDYVRHGAQYGGLREVWAAASEDLAPLDLGELAMVLRSMPERRRGGDGRIIEGRFSLGRDEVAGLVRRLLDVGVGDADVCRLTGASVAMVGAVRHDPPKSADSTPGSSGVIRNETVSAGDCPDGMVEAVRSPRMRVCSWCSAPLPRTLRGDARYCLGGRCKQAAHRASPARA